LTSARALAAAAVGVVILVIVWLLVFALPRWYGPRVQQPTAAAARVAPATQPHAAGRRIKAHLFYVADDGVSLIPVERDIAFGESPLEQARLIVAAQIAPVAEPTVSAIPSGTTLRALFLGEGGDAFVDFSREMVARHPGGTVNELLTVYTIVNALTANLPAITSVQILVDGKEVDTLAGHVDLRRPIVRNAALLKTS
jgi:spore germination protein GerM